jgi:hypothetical protein
MVANSSFVSPPHVAKDGEVVAGHVEEGVGETDREPVLEAAPQERFRVAELDARQTLDHQADDHQEDEDRDDSVAQGGRLMGGSPKYHAAG